MIEVTEGIKTIQIHAQTRYPIVSAYEFEFLKSEKELQALIKPCTIYFIIQRPLIYINNFIASDGVVSFEITDDNDTPPLICTFEPSANVFCKHHEEILIDAQFYKKEADIDQPFHFMAGFKILTLEKEFLGWFSPQKFIYEYLSGGIKTEIQGNIENYIDYTVHYIGKAFSQDIWERLTGHHKMQSILTLEDSLNTNELKAPFEISLLMLDIDGFEEATIFPDFDFAVSEGVEPIVYTFNFEDDNEAFEDYFTPNLAPKAAELTTEAEALMVNTFKPKYNDILYNNYPNIKNGTRDAGYTECTLMIEKLPAILRTESYVQNVILPIQT